MIPSPWAFALLALAAFRVWKLIAEDTILDRPLKRVREWEMVGCAWCAGAWIAFIWTEAFWIWPHWTLVTATPFALSAAVAAVSVTLDRIADS